MQETLIEGGIYRLLWPKAMYSILREPAEFSPVYHVHCTYTLYIYLTLDDIRGYDCIKRVDGDNFKTNV
jgi:hypothetical protein